MRIALFIRSLQMGGAEKQSILLSRYFSETYKTYLIIFYPEGEFLQLAQNEEINIVKLNGNIFVKIIKLFFFLNKHIDVLINFLPLNNIVGGIIGKLAGVNHIMGSIRGTKIKSSKFKMILQKFVCNYFSDAFISNSEAGAKNYIKYGYSKEKVHVISNAIKIDNTNEKNIASDPDKVNILSVGRFIDEKDYPTALKAIKELYKRVGECIKYNIVGYGPKISYIRELVHSFNLNTIVEIHENILPKDIDNYYKSSDIFLITSKHEGMPNSLMEAISYKLPVITTNSGDSEMLVKNNYNGYVCEIGDYIDISNKLYILVYDKEKKIMFGRNGYSFIKDYYSPSVIGDKWFQLFKDLNIDE